MNKLEFYNRQKDSWTDDENQSITEKYQTNGLDINQIADLHRRTPGSIAYKLKNLGVVSNNFNARGYKKYKESELYKEIIDTGKPRTKKALEIELTESQRELIELRREITELRIDVQEILSILRISYR